MKNKIKNIVIYQAKNGAVEFRGDFDNETVWGSLQQIAELFDVQKPAISKHLKNIFQDGELEKEATVSILETVQTEGGRQITRKLEYYNLDAILSVGYRVNSKQATRFRIWATKTLKQHLVQGYTINKKHLAQNYEKFMRAVADVKVLLPKSGEVKVADILELINTFAGTWFSLDAYDKEKLPQSGVSKKQIEFTAEELSVALAQLKQELIQKNEATNLFGHERQTDSIEAIVGNVFQSAFGQVYQY